jgi:hypothetical protein
MLEIGRIHCDSIMNSAADRDPLQIVEYWQLGCKVLNLPGTDVSTYLDGLKARAGRANARLKSIGVPVG